MKAGTFLKLALVYLVTTFIVAAGWHLVIFQPLYDQLAIFSRKEPLVPLGLLAMSIQSVIMATLYPVYVQNRSGFIDGVKFSLTMGVFMASSAVFAEAGKQNVTSLPTWLILESIYYVIQFTLVGILMTLVLKKDRERAASSAEASH